MLFYFELKIVEKCWASFAGAGKASDAEPGVGMKNRSVPSMQNARRMNTSPAEEK